MEDTQLKKSDKLPIVNDPFNFICQKIMEQPEPINFVVTGANTNLSHSFESIPSN
jgi:inosine-uridine nucleoside N-ribohydrolase